MAAKTYGRTALTGGTAGSLDEYDADNLNDGDRCMTVLSTGVYYIHRLNATSGAVESSPDVIKPDSGGGVSPYVGDKRWVLSSTGSLVISDLTASKPVFTDASKKLVSTGTLGVDQGGTGAVTLDDGGLVVGNTTGAVEVVAPGATTTILVGGGAATKPTWETVTGTGAPVKANTPTLVTPLLGTPTSGDLQNCTAAVEGTKGVSPLASDAESVTGTSDTVVVTPGNLTARLAAPGAIGGTTPAAGSFTTLGASGDVNVTGNLISAAGVIIDYVSVNDAARTNTTLSTDHIVGFIALTATRNYQISSEDIAQAGRVFIVKDEVGKAATFPITISTEGAETIDGAATISISSNYGAVYLYSNGSNLFIY